MTRKDFEHIAPSLRPLMFKVAQDFFGNNDDAEDATQEAMVRLWNYCEHIDTTQNVEGLAIRVTKNCCVSLSRKQRVRTDLNHLPPFSVLTHQPSFPEFYLRTPSALYPSPHELLEAQDTQSMLTEVIDRLQPRERQLFEMRRLEGLSLDEIVARTGIPKTSVKAMVSMARKKVFNELKQRLKQ